MKFETAQQMYIHLRDQFEYIDEYDYSLKVADEATLEAYHKHLQDALESLEEASEIIADGFSV